MWNHRFSSLASWFFPPCFPPTTHFASLPNWCSLYLRSHQICPPDSLVNAKASVFSFFGATTFSWPVGIKYNLWKHLNWRAHPNLLLTQLSSSIALQLLPLKGFTRHWEALEFCNSIIMLLLLIIIWPVQYMASQQMGFLLAKKSDRDINCLQRGPLHVLFNVCIQIIIWDVFHLP